MDHLTDVKSAAQTSYSGLGHWKDSWLGRAQHALSKHQPFAPKLLFLLVVTSCVQKSTAGQSMSSQLPALTSWLLAPAPAWVVPPLGRNPSLIH